MAIESRPKRTQLIQLQAQSGALSDRVFKRHVPAWVISAGLHAALLSLFIAFDLLVGANARKEAVASDNQEIVTKFEEEDRSFNPENPDPGLDPNLPLSYNLDRKENVNIPGKILADESLGNM